ncbi:FtsX-like permease family protein [Pleurocapsales cyanobacterium LEGE 10410]|nr:FtsX-like permease family protein [Pleurocapsales cyanobacterium LEGE 10410]
MPLKTLLKKFTQEPPLGWAQLSHQKIRMIVAVSGIAFADILIFMQLGFYHSIFDGVTRVNENLTGDLYLVSSRAKFIDDGQNFDRRHLYQADAVEGIDSASPFYYSHAGWVNPWNKKVTDVAILAFDPTRPVLNLPDVNQQLSQIKLPDKVLVDRQARPDLGAIAQSFDNGEPVVTEVSGRRIRVGGMFDFGSTLFVEGFLVTSDWNYLRLNGADSIDQVKVGVLNIDSGENLETVKARVRASMPAEVAVMTHQEFVAAEKDFWDKNHPAGAIFNFGVAMGFVVGVVIVYQVLFADVNDHLSEYATLKAMGYRDRNLLTVVFQEATILAVLGFVPGLVASIGMYGLLESLTQMPLAMSSEVAWRVFSLTVTMCLASGAIAIRKLQSADPADVF